MFCGNLQHMIINASINWSLWGMQILSSDSVNTIWQVPTWLTQHIQPQLLSKCLLDKLLLCRNFCVILLFPEMEFMKYDFT